MAKINQAKSYDILNSLGGVCTGGVLCPGPGVTVVCPGSVGPVPGVGPAVAGGAAVGRHSGILQQASFGSLIRRQ